MEEITTTDLAKFGHRERMELEKILHAWNTSGLPVDFGNEDVRATVNLNSGYVFLTNSDYQAAMMNGDKLESFYSCPECGHEGFLDEMKHDGKAECKRYLKDIRAGLK